jgi:hypothetical protein
MVYCLSLFIHDCACPDTAANEMLGNPLCHISIRDKIVSVSQ